MKSSINKAKKIVKLISKKSIHDISLFSFLLFGCLVLFLPNNFIFSQSNLPEWPKYEKYEGLLRDSYLRINQLKEKLAKGEQPPQVLKLIFSGYMGNFLEFYDKKGESVFIRYREDRFDKKSIKKYSEIIPGLAYEIDVELKGVKMLEKMTPFSNIQEFQKIVKNEDAVLIFKIFGLRILRLKQIRF